MIHKARIVCALLCYTTSELSGEFHVRKQDRLFMISPMLTNRALQSMEFIHCHYSLYGSQILRVRDHPLVSCALGIKYNWIHIKVIGKKILLGNALHLIFFSPTRLSCLVIWEASVSYLAPHLGNFSVVCSCHVLRIFAVDVCRIGNVCCLPMPPHQPFSCNSLDPSAPEEA